MEHHNNKPPRLPWLYHLLSALWGAKPGSIQDRLLDAVDKYGWCCLLADESEAQQKRKTYQRGSWRKFSSGLVWVAWGYPRVLSRIDDRLFKTKFLLVFARLAACQAFSAKVRELKSNLHQTTSRLWRGTFPFCYQLGRQIFFMDQRKRKSCQ